MIDSMDYRRLSELGERVKGGIATKVEKDEFMELLHNNGSITDRQYQEYQNNQNMEEILNAALAIGAIILIAYLLKEILGTK